MTTNRTVESGILKLPSWWTGVPELTGLTAVVTGANRGIGFEVARCLASRGAVVLMAVRSLDRGREAATAIRESWAGASVEVVELDLANLASVRRCADAVRSRLQRLDLLINNAGIASRSLQYTVDGFELVFGTNHLGHFALTGHLLPLILATPRARVVSVASLAHSRGQIDFENLDGSKHYSDMQSYSESKLASVLFAYELERRLVRVGADQISVACHPGWAATHMSHTPAGQAEPLMDRLVQALTRRIAPTAAAGSRSIVFAATSPDVHGGDYIGPGGPGGMSGAPVKAMSSARSHDQDLAHELWRTSEDMTGIHYEFSPRQVASALSR